MLRFLTIFSAAVVTSREGRVSRNIAYVVEGLIAQVTSREGRVSRNIVEDWPELPDDVTSREGRVSRNWNILL